MRRRRRFPGRNPTPRRGHYRWLTPVAAAAVVLPGSYFGVSAALEHLSSGRGEAVASSVGCQVGCGTSPASASASPAGGPSPGRTPRTPARTPRTQAAAAKARPAQVGSPRPSSPAATPHPTQTPTTPPPPPPVTAGYQKQNQWPGGFMGKFTVVNHGSQPVGGWELKITLPGDMVTGVFGGNWSQNGDVVTLQPFPGQGGLAPGAVETITITANGSAAAPSSCTVNGHACS